MKTTAFKFYACAALAGGLLSFGVVAACDSSSGVHETPPGTDSGGDTAAPPGDSGGGDTSTLPDGPPAPDDCVVNPTTHLEIINACTDASRFDKKPNLPLLLADGGLPPLP